jgi:hypothetical protein
MASRTLLSPLLAVILTAMACKVPEAATPEPPTSTSDGSGASAPEAPSTAPDAPGAPSGAETPSAGEPGVSPAPSATPGAPPGPNERPGPPLPELRVKSYGLHVGGAAKDSEQRKEAQRTLERGFPRYLDCYRLIEEPGSEGTFGADLRVAAEGGRPKVDQPRTKLRGETFRACMVKAFESARFDPPSSGRTIVVRYSVKFSFGW